MPSEKRLNVDRAIAAVIILAGIALVAMVLFLPALSLELAPIYRF